MSENRRERLVEIQKREQLKGMLVNKFKLKYGNHSTISKFIENEVQRFLANDRLTEVNLKALDIKIMREAENRDKKSQIMEDRKSVGARSASAHSQVSRRSAGGLSAAALSQLNARNADQKSKAGDMASQRSRRSASSQQSRASIARSILSSKKPMTEAYSEINENDEWVAIQKFNTLLHYEEQKQAVLREAERKRLIKEELDRQVAAKKAREEADKQENQLYNEMWEEHGKLLEEREKEKQQAIHAKIINDKNSRDVQLREEQRKKKTDTKENYNLEKEYIDRLKSEMEQERMT